MTELITAAALQLSSFCLNRLPYWAANSFSAKTSLSPLKRVLS
ncbi:hypothetical protein N9Y74_03035 [Alphaproteobacteria bacterium]|nr:hypothetical protein [Alphaproteobacteria bacterium]